MSDLISREELTKKLEYLCDCLCDYSKRQREVMCDSCKLGAVIDAVEEMPSVEPEKCGDCISRQAAEEKLKKVVDEMALIFADIREKNVDDSVCGLCEYDCDHGIDGYANECPGFERDDCFKLKEEYQKEWTDLSNIPSVEPERNQSGWTKYDDDDPETWPEDGSWGLWQHKSGALAVLRWKQDAQNHFYPDPDMWNIEDVVAWMPLPKPYMEEVNG